MPSTQTFSSIPANCRRVESKDRPIIFVSWCFCYQKIAFLCRSSWKWGSTNGFWRLTGVLLSRSQRSVLAALRLSTFPSAFPQPHFSSPVFLFCLIFRSQFLLLLHLHLFTATTTTRLVPYACMSVCWACGYARVCVWARKILIHFSDFRFGDYFCTSGAVTPWFFTF